MKESFTKEKEVESGYTETKIDKLSMRANGSMISFLDHSD
jgi:hypothetical protein